MKLIVISPPDNLPQEYSLVRAMMENDLLCYHVRKPGFGQEEMQRYIESVPGEFHNRLVIHSHHGLADEFGLKGIHFTSGIPYADGGNKKISRSISLHSLEQMEDAKKLKGLSYGFLSPVFDSISKKGYSAAFEMEALKDLLQKERAWDVFALGGILPENVELADELGFDGVAALGAVWMTADPLSAFRVLKNYCKTEIVPVKK
jgi:thiamine-phosphate pyrophosphorylase